MQPWQTWRRQIFGILIVVVVLLVLQPQPQSEALRVALGDGLEAWTQHEHQAAIAALERAIDLEPNLSELHLVIVDLALEGEQIETAKKHLALLPSGLLTDEEIQCRLAQVALLEDPGHFVFDVELVNIVECPDLMVRLKSQIVILRAAQDRASSMALLQVVVSLWPQDTAAQTQLVILETIIDPLAAVPRLREVSEMTGDSNEMVLALIRAIEDSRVNNDAAFTFAQVGQTFARFNAWQEAGWAMEQALQIEPNYPEASAYLGMALTQQGLDGYAHLVEALTALPNDPLPYLFFGLHWRLQGELNLAQIFLEDAIDIDPQNPAAWAELGAVYAQQGAFDEAKAAFQQATLIDPLDEQFWLLLARFSTGYEIEIETLGLPAARNAVGLAPTNPLALDTLGFAHYLNGNLLLAERLFVLALSINPSQAITHFHLGLLHRARGNPESALAAFQQALFLDPTGPVGEAASRILNPSLSEE